MTFYIREISNSEGQLWDELICSSKQGNIFLCHDFLQAWDRTNPAVGSLRLGCYNKDNKLIGAQILVFRKILFLRFQGISYAYYGSSPIIKDQLGEEDPNPYEILSALARESKKYFPYLRLELHPSLNDIRAYLDQGWDAYPQATYIWDLRDLDAVLKQMHRKSCYVRKAQSLYNFECAPGHTITNEFLSLYEETMEKYEWKPTRTWKKAFISRLQWLEEQDLLRAYTCRTKSGDLIGIVLYILSYKDRTAYFWLVGYDHKLNTKEFPPAIHFYAAQCLAKEFSFIDFGEGTHPSLYAFKDSLGGHIKLYWVLKTQGTSHWIRFYTFLKSTFYTLSKIRQQFH